MSYQPYPTSGFAQSPSQSPPQPASIRTAVRLMWGGSGLALLGAIFTIVLLGRLRTNVLNTLIKNNATARSEGKTFLTLAQIHSFVHGYVVAIVAAGIISVLLWVWMAWANNRGASWARIVGSVLFALLTIGVFLSLRGASFSIFYLLEWLLGLGATIFLWRKDSSEYFAQSRLR